MSSRPLRLVGQGPSVAILSLRSLRKVPYYGAIVESEDVLAACLGARVYTLELNLRLLRYGLLASTQVHRLVSASGLAHPYCVAPDWREVPRADVQLIMVNDMHDLTMVMGAEGWNLLGEQVVVYLNEVGFRELRYFKDSIGRMQRSVDHVFYGFDLIPPERFRRRRVRTVASVPVMLDVGRFPYRSHADRPIDVLNFGRRDDGQHRVLRHWADSSDGYYEYDTGRLVAVGSLADHRHHFASRAVRARVMITNYARFDEPDKTRGHEYPGLRYWEAMAAGCVLAGHHPVMADLHRSAVASIGPLSLPLGASGLPEDLTAVLADRKESDRLGRQARRAALRGHDVAHRWLAIAELAGLPLSAGIQARIDELESEAARLGT